jgi:flagellar motor switch protein FliN/FliY
MLAQKDIDAVLADAKQAVESLASDVGRLTGSSAPSATEFVASSDSNPESSPPLIAEPLSPCVRRILRLRVPVSVRLADRNMPVGEVLKFAPGNIVEFDRPVDSELDLMVGNRQIGTGVAVKYNEHFGIRVSYIGDVRQRIESLTG